MSEPSIAAGLRSLANRQKYQIDSNLLMRLARDADLLAARLAEAEKWRDYYRAKWLGEFAVPQPDPPADSASEVQHGRD